VVTADLVIRVVVVLLASYLVGGVPWALVVGRRLHGIDLREHGSGNLGATNVFRTLGARAAILTLLLDASKGAVAVVGAGIAVSADTFGTPVHEWTRVGAMLAAVLGHSYSPYIRLSGGKGVATSAGALFVLTPVAAAIELCIFAVIVGTTRIVSLGSVIIALLYPLLVLWLYPGDVPILITITGLAALVIWRHRSNIVRIVRGEERKIAVRTDGDARDETKE